ncbi:MAG: hypothetical protein AAFO93_12350 [Pseudomonadota bacterium]
MIDVLGDLKGFAEKNEMPRLAEELDRAILVALTESASKGLGAPLRVVDRDGNTTRTVYRTA